MKNMADSYYMELGGKVNGVFNRNWFINVEDHCIGDFIEKKKRQCNNTDFYYCVYYRSSIDKSNKPSLIAPIYIDIDGKSLEPSEYENTKIEALTIIQILKNHFMFNEPDLQIFFSGSKGFHIVIPPDVLNIEPCIDLNIKYKSFVSKIKELAPSLKCIDTKIYDNRRLFRMPNSINSKTGAYKIQINEAELRSMSISEMLTLAENPRNIAAPDISYNDRARKAFDNAIKQNTKNRQRGQQQPRKISVLPESERKLFPCNIYLLQNNTEKGNRNNMASMLSVSLMAAGWSYAETLGIINTWNQGNNPPLDDREVEAVVNSAATLCSDGKIYGCATYSSVVPNEICQKCSIHNKRN